MSEVRVLYNGALNGTTTGTGYTGYPTPPGEFIACQVELSGIGGTSPNYTFSLQWSNDGVNWCDADPVEPFTAITANKNAAKVFQPKGPFVRLYAVVTGTSPVATVVVQVNSLCD